MRARTWAVVGPVLPGLLLVAGVAAVARASTLVLPSIISEVTVGVVLGIAVANLVALPAAVKPGTKVAVNRLLRLGIVLLGARLFLGDVLNTGLGALAVVIIGMTIVLVVTLGLGRLLRLPTRLSLLIGVGTAVCGNSAIIATAPVIEAEERDVSFAVATITVFGTLAVLLYPLIGHAVGMSDAFFGHWAGIAVNDTSQVTATGFAYSQAAGETATVVKLTRNTLMGPLIVLIGAWYLRSGTARGSAAVGAASRRGILKAVPLFVIGFIAMALLNSAGLIPAALDGPLGEMAKALILAALVGVGLSTDLGALRKVGITPFYLGLAVATLLSVLSLVLLVTLVRP